MKSFLGCVKILRRYVKSFLGCVKISRTYVTSFLGCVKILKTYVKRFLGCVKIYKKPRDTDGRGKYIPKHKRGPDVELFKGLELSNDQLELSNNQTCQKNNQSALSVSYPRLFHYGSKIIKA